MTPPINIFLNFIEIFTIKLILITQNKRQRQQRVPKFGYSAVYS